MHKLRGSPALIGASLFGVILLCSSFVAAENTDPDNNDSQFAWAENLGWLNAEPSGDGGPGLQVGDSEVSGWLWAENAGWISFSCSNTLSCSAVNFGVVNNGGGVLSGYGWSENAGWISFSCTNTASCGTVNYGVTIDDSTGVFNGYAWSENAGWISFNCANTSSCGAVDYKVKVGWVCDPTPAAPVATSDLELDPLGSDVLLQWNLIPDATGSDVIRGSLSALRSSNGDFSTATVACLDDNRTTSSLAFAGTPALGDAYWFLVRGQNCGGNSTYNSGGPGQAGLRDAEIAASGNGCP